MKLSCGSVAAPEGAAATLVTSVLPVEIGRNGVYVSWPNPAGFLVLPPFQEFHENAAIVRMAVIRRPEAWAQAKY